MNSKKVFFGLVGTLGVLGILIVVTGVVGVKMLRSSADTLNTAKLESQVIERQRRALVQARKDITEYAELRDLAKRIVPQDKDQARTVREIITYAERARITIKSVTFPESTLGQKAPAVAGAPATGGTAATPAAPEKISQVEPVPGIAGVFKMNVNIQTDSAIAFNEFIKFLESLEQNRRTAQVDSITITPDEDNRSLLTFSISFNVYVKP